MEDDMQLYHSFSIRMQTKLHEQIEVWYEPYS